jgi:hypothetical protein
VRWVLLLLLTAAPAAATRLDWPAAEAGTLARLAALCPDCRARGVIACGTADVAVGRRFARTFLAGTPPRGYLPAFRIDGTEFRRLARTTPEHARLLAALEERFAGTPLAVVEDGFGGVRVLSPPRSVQVVFPPALHDCVRDPARPWGCCVAGCAERECCEKGLGSPSVTVEWRDDDAGETLVLHFSHTTGESTLRRTGASGTTRYYCLTGAPGFLRSAAAP